MKKAKSQDNIISKKILDIIKKEVKKEIKKELSNNGWLKTWSGTIDASGNVLLASDESTAITLTNKSGEVLAEGDEVYVASRSGDLSDAFIWLVK